ncbi:MAG: VanZ family protein [Bacteroidota bacterium]
MVRWQKIIGVLFWLGLIAVFVSSVIPHSVQTLKEHSNNEQFFRLDYFLHFVFYFLLITLFYSWDRGKKIAKRNTLMFFMLAIVYASLNEFVQYVIEYRTFNPVDLFFNVMGVVVAILVNHRRKIL